MAEPHARQHHDGDRLAEWRDRAPGSPPRRTDAGERHAARRGALGRAGTDPGPLAQRRRPGSAPLTASGSGVRGTRDAMARAKGESGDVVAERRRWVDRRVRTQPTPRWRQGQAANDDGGAVRRVVAHQHRTPGSRMLHRFGDASTHAAAGLVAAGFVIAWLTVGIITGFPEWWETAFY